MSLAVVRCPGCRGASRVSADALGQMVGCPRCQMPFVAEEDVPVVVPKARPVARKSVVPVAPRTRPVEGAPPDDAPVEAADAVPDPEHDPHARPIAGLPVSVLVGLALVPFGIPLLWRVAPFVTGQEAVLSLAVPVALAVAASALCLGVVYTIDWTATTRVKGVLMLVGLSYLAAAGLFFLKKDLMDRVRAWADPSLRWSVVYLDKGKCQVLMPGHPTPDVGQPLSGLAKMSEGRQSLFQPEPGGPQYEYRFAVGEPTVPLKLADDAWFARVGEQLQLNARGGRLVGDGPRTVNPINGFGREWTFEISRDATRIVRVYVVGDRVYYLHAEGPSLTAEEAEFGRQFFDKFSVNN